MKGWGLKSLLKVDERKYNCTRTNPSIFFNGLFSLTDFAHPEQATSHHLHNDHAMHKELERNNSNSSETPSRYNISNDSFL